MISETLKAKVRELFLVHEDKLFSEISPELACHLEDEGLIGEYGETAHGSGISVFALTSDGIELALDHDRIIEQAKDRLLPFGLDADKYDWTEDRESNDGLWFNRQVVAKLKSDPDYQIMLTAIWVNERGDILQAGSNYGILTL